MNSSSRSRAAQEFLDLFNGDLSAAIDILKKSKPIKSKKKRPVNKNPVIVQVESVSKNYKLGKQTVQALNDVSIEIREGEFIALTGPSGSGKSTLLQLIGGLDKPSEGKVLVADNDLAKLSDRKLSFFRGQTIGFVFQFFYLQPFLSVQTNLEVPGMFSRTKHNDRVKKATELSDKVGLSERMKHKPKELSGGQMQRAAIARALLNNPKIILADEPTGNLDSVNGKAIIDLFEQVRSELGTTIIIVTHDSTVARRADREIELSDGVIVGGLK